MKQKMSFHDILGKCYSKDVFSCCKVLQTICMKSCLQSGLQLISWLAMPVQGLWNLITEMFVNFGIVSDIRNLGKESLQIDGLKFLNIHSRHDKYAYWISYCSFYSIIIVSLSMLYNCIYSNVVKE